MFAFQVAALQHPSSVQFMMVKLLCCHQVLPHKPSKIAAALVAFWRVPAPKNGQFASGIIMLC
jgi:hypothetical protein